jgi:hypothetical protein
LSDESSPAGENGNGAVRERVARVEAARERVPVGHLLTVAGLIGGFVLYLQASNARMEESFDLRLTRLDEALQREQRDLDRTLEVQIEHLRALSSVNDGRFVAFIDSFRVWQLEQIEANAYARGKTDARLDSLERAYQSQ